MKIVAGGEKLTWRNPLLTDLWRWPAPQTALCPGCHQSLQISDNSHQQHPDPASDHHTPKSVQPKAKEYLTVSKAQTLQR